MIDCTVVRCGSAACTISAIGSQQNPKSDVGYRAVNPEPSCRLPLPRRYQHGTEQ